MYGWRLRIGLIVPSSNTVMEPEMNAIVPEGVSIHATRIYLPMKVADVDSLAKMAEQADRAVEELLTAHVNVIVYGCTSGSLFRGGRYDKELIGRIQRNSSKIMATTASTAVLEAIKGLKLRRIAVITPYIKEVNVKLRNFFEGNGIDVRTVRSLVNENQNLDIATIEPFCIYSHAKEIDSPDVEGVLISCTDLRTLEIIEDLEEDLGKPVISSNTASFWHSLYMAGIHTKIRHYGRLIGSL